LKTDSLFYRLFQTFLPLLFELIGFTPTHPEAYQFRSVEIKQTAFRLDGVFVPTAEEQEHSPIFFVEVQFQPQGTSTAASLLKYLSTYANISLLIPGRRW
jgi:predicted transposase/invertase (TIGR01784 family)